ncbi:MAG TPA: DUF5615 family PIN-like protein [Bryobacteraceae bacterium]|nr:DUF5615 family PIN-like protein [Bryobacteraceae bacterium]
MIRLLLDQGLPRSAAAILRDAGIDTLHIADLGRCEASDVEIIELGLSENRTIATLDADFHALLAVSGALAPSVIRIRIEGLKGSDIAEILKTGMTLMAEELREGAIATVTTKGIRIRRLPIHRRGTFDLL